MEIWIVYIKITPSCQREGLEPPQSVLVCGAHSTRFSILCEFYFIFTFQAVWHRHHEDGLRRLKTLSLASSNSLTIFRQSLESWRATLNLKCNSVTHDTSLPRDTPGRACLALYILRPRTATDHSRRALCESHTPPPCTPSEMHANVEG